MNPNQGYISYIINPKSGSTCIDLSDRNLQRYLLGNGFDLRINRTSSLSNACELASEAASDDKCAMVVVVGGDGTIREVAHGLQGSSKPMLIVPRGTENLLANELGFDEKPDTAIKAFRDGCIRTLDLGCVNNKCFTSIAGFGFDGDIVKRVNEQRKGHISHLDYFWPIWRTFWDYKFSSMKVNADGEDIFEGPAIVFVGNISRYAMGLDILKFADYSDGLLDICILKCAGRLHLIKHSIFVTLKQHVKTSDVIYAQAKKIKITSQSNISSQIDGDPGPELPAEIKVIPNAIKCFVPKNAKPAGIRTRIIRVLR